MAFEPTLAVEVVLPIRALLVLNFIGLFFLLWVLNLVRHEVATQSHRVFSFFEDSLVTEWRIAEVLSRSHGFRTSH